MRFVASSLAEMSYISRVGTTGAIIYMDSEARGFYDCMNYAYIESIVV